jgi:hypothetical protein
MVGSNPAGVTLVQTPGVGIVTACAKFAFSARLSSKRNNAPGKRRPRSPAEAKNREHDMEPSPKPLQKIRGQVDS